MKCLLNSRAVRVLPKLLLIAAVFSASTAQAVRIKDVADIAVVRTNHLIGYGLVVGLPGTGDKTTQAPFTVQSLKNMLQQLGVTIPANVNPQLKNVAAVAVLLVSSVSIRIPKHRIATMSMTGNPPRPAV